jgi:hypothetical protein
VEEQDFVVTLASGGTVRVTGEHVEVQPANPALPPDVTDLRNIKDVRRIGDYILIRRIRRRTMQITFVSDDDAELLEAHIRAALADGTAFTSHVPAAVGHVSRNDRRLPLGMLVCALLVVVGSLGPWAIVQGEAISGMDGVGGGDGSLTFTFGIIAGVLAGLLVWQPWRRGWVPGLIFLSFVLIALVGFDDWSDVGRTADEVAVEARVGWGLPLLSIAAGIGVAFVVAHYWYARRSRDSASVAEPVE